MCKKKSFRIGQNRLRINTFLLSSEIYEAQRAGNSRNVRCPEIKSHNAYET